MSIAREQDGIRRVVELLDDHITDEVSRSGGIRIMEVCGTHTMAFAREGLRRLLPHTIELRSGPGCPVCVCPPHTVAAAIDLARRDNVVLATFGDMLRVPVNSTSLAKARGEGARVKIIYSPLDALDHARLHPDRDVVLFAAGFETTAPCVAAALKRAAGDDLRNFFLLDALRMIPPAMHTLVTQHDHGIEGFICPGHVSAIIGTGPYHPLAKIHGIPCTVAGFEAPDMLRAILHIMRQRNRGKARVENLYGRVVRPEGNPRALALLDEVFTVSAGEWRGLGTIPGSACRLAAPYARFDAMTHFQVSRPRVDEQPRDCVCGLVLSGRCEPAECAQFGTGCHPASPLGPCMVSSEGSCAAHYRYASRKTGDNQS